MNISANNLYQEMQSLAVEASNFSKPKQPIETIQGSSQVEFNNLLKDALDTVSGLQAESKAKATALEMGDRNVSLAEVMIASQKSSVAFEATVQVRNKLVEAYKDIMNMPV
ncbi:flagellar hook-basal body complex protein FliE [Pseudoalteromonas piratica]|jgi:flagellar hook-basal body complex protein FliE|uniref:Flagellar hook-basal body complex protein FliE n=1 Tax=Pseudoalteromonas piratica TaxID=1348114 RepID=A0A0A7EEP2_9GAMM|nr:flagellar hook-basal body complex protein FliE [Pseudoalteromonas piratica]AIY65069.1 flagellar hook-basal body protein FliE [Pseudoalteromonas piratica]